MAEKKLTKQQEVEKISKMVRERRPTAEIIKELKAMGRDKEANALEASSGIFSTVVGSVTGIPDLLVGGYNWLMDKEQQPTYRERALEAVNMPTEPTLDTKVAGVVPLYSAPDVLTAAAGIYELGRSGIKALRSWRQSSKIKDFKKTLPPDVRNKFDKWMVTGQGSSDPQVAAVIQGLKKDPKYAELFNALEDAATKAAIKDTAPAASRLTKEQARAGAVTRVQAEIKGLKDARASAGNRMFERAFGFAEDRGLVDQKNLLKVVDKLRADFSTKNTPSAQNAVNYLDNLKARIAAPEMTLGEAQRLRAAGLPVTGKLTARQTQAILSEFGKKASEGDVLIPQLSLSDETRISKAIFGAVKDDLKWSLANAPDRNDKAALRFLSQARDEIAEASDNYNKVVSQGIPAFLKDKTLAEVSFEDLYDAYRKATPEQRVWFRDTLKNTDADALSNIDSNVYSDFIRSSQAEKADGTFGIDLRAMAKNWSKMSPSEQDLVTSSMGVAPKEFAERMRDALVFTRKFDIAKSAEDPGIAPRVVRDVGRAAGAGISYGAKQAVDLTADVVMAALKKKGLSDDLLMKALLNPQAAAVLKQATLSPNALDTLTMLTNMEKLPVALPSFVSAGPVSGMAFGGAVPGIPDNLFSNEAPDDLFSVPDDLFTADSNLGMDTTSPESALRSRVGPGGVVQSGNINQLDINTIMQDPAMANNPEAQSIVRQLGLFPQ